MLLALKRGMVEIACHSPPPQQNVFPLLVTLIALENPWRRPCLLRTGTLRPVVPLLLTYILELRFYHFRWTLNSFSISALTYNVELT